MSSLFGSTTIKGTRITDFSSTSADIGIPLPFGYGRVPAPGNIIFAPMPPVEHRQVKRQGKGGVKQETFTYTLSYAVAFMQGPTFGWWWIKRNGKIVYTQDPNAPIEDKDYAAKWAQRVNFYNGTMDQMPDSVIESYEGAGNVSAFRKLVYFTVEDEDVTDNGGAPPNYEACLIATPPEAYLTSKVYPQLFDAEVSTTAGVSSVTLYDLLKEVDAASDDTEEEVAFQGGVLAVNLPHQTVDSTDEEVTFTGGLLSVPPQATPDPDETTETVSFDGGALITPPQATPDPEETIETVSFTGGQLRVP